ncbi:MAG: dihydrodipicolinate synthase family protein [Alphaproteobacteria bacterium]|nr:dihydrodipicolinate synthase family protein [Alphaproteobacteria bacterium]
MTAKLADPPSARAAAPNVDAKRLHGVWCPTLTPVDADLNPDTGRLHEHVAWLLEGGCHGVGLFGTTGEANSFSVAERKAVLESVVAAGVPTDRLMVGTGCCALTDTVALTRHAAELGCRNVLMLPPFYYKGVSDEALHRSYGEVIDRVADPDLVICLYHFPKLSGVPITLGLIERLVASFPDTIGGVKDSSGDPDSLAAFLAAFPDLAIFPGSEVLLLDGLKQGGAGCITATANVHAAAVRRVYGSWTASDGETEDRQAYATAIRETIQTQPMIPMLKNLVAGARGDADWLRVRPPMIELGDAARADVERKLDDLGFVFGG